MERIATWPAADRAELIREASALKPMPAEVMEKDFWVCWVLNRLFRSSGMARKILFKGGTSLSKVFGLIERFSEDVDLILDWREVTGEDPAEARSVSKQDKFNKALLAHAHEYLRDTFLPEVQALVGNVCEAVIEDNPEVVLIKYPVSFPSDYLRREICLEVGPLASWHPHAEYTVKPYAADVLPDAFEQPACTVRAIKAERTFWEKITILHHEAHRPENNIQPTGYSRHYYDACQMAKTAVKAGAVADLRLLEGVVAFKDKFYHRGWARYDLAKPGTMRLAPPPHVRNSLESDYAAMEFMFYGARPEFADMMAQISDLEREINSLS